MCNHLLIQKQCFRLTVYGLSFARPKVEMYHYCSYVNSSAFYESHASGRPLYKLKFLQFALGGPTACEAIRAEIHDYNSCIDSSTFYKSHVFGYQVYKLKILQSNLESPGS